MPVDNKYLGRPLEWLKHMCARVDNPEDVGYVFLKQYNCYMLIHTAGDIFTQCVILSEPYPMTTEEWVKTVMPPLDYCGRRYGNLIRIRKVV